MQKTQRAAYQVRWLVLVLLPLLLPLLLLLLPATAAAAALLLPLASHTDVAGARRPRRRHQQLRGQLVHLLPSLLLPAAAAACRLRRLRDTGLLKR